MVIVKILCSLFVSIALCNAFSHVRGPCRASQTLSQAARKRCVLSMEASPSTSAENARSQVGSFLKAGAALMASQLALRKNAVAAGDLGTVVVLGSGGQTGKLVVDDLIKAGVKVRPTYRSNIPTKYDGMSGVDKPAFVDVTDAASIGAAIEGAGAVVFAASASKKGGTAEQVDYLGVANVANECVRLKIPRLVVISSGAITKPNSLGFKITNLFGRIMEYKLKGEKALAEAYEKANDPNLGYVIIRPGGLGGGDAEGPGLVELNQGDTISGEISRADVAECTVAAALSKSIPSRVIFEMYAADKRGPLEGKYPQQSGYERSGKTLKATSYDTLFEGLQKGDLSVASTK